MYFIDKRIQVICDELRRERIRDPLRHGLLEL